MCQVVVMGFWNRFDLWSPLAGPRKIAETNCRAVPSTTRKLYLFRKRTIEIGYLPNRSTLLSASTIGRTNGVARDGKEFIFLRLEWISNLSFWRWQPVVKLRAALSRKPFSTTNRLPLPMLVLVASSSAKFT